MDPALADLLGDALKIIAPAAVTEFTAYKAAELQFQATLQKIREENEFLERKMSVLFRKYIDEHG